MFPMTTVLLKVDLEKNKLPVTRTLSASWTAQEDHFLFHYSPFPEDFEHTKRIVLRKTETVVRFARISFPFRD